MTINIKNWIKNLSMSLRWKKKINNNELGAKWNATWSDIEFEFHLYLLGTVP